jgi:hypothetical protein
MTAPSEMKGAAKSADTLNEIAGRFAPAVTADAAAQSALSEAHQPPEVAAVSVMNDVPGEWTRSEISDRLDAISQLLASSGGGAVPGKLDTDLLQKLAHSQHSLAAIEQRLGQLAGAGVLEFTESAYRDGTRATAVTALATALISDETMPLAMADSTKAVMNANNALTIRTPPEGLSRRRNHSGWMRSGT